MQQQERYLFDLQGFLVIENALSEQTLDSLNRHINQQLESIETADQTWLRFNGVLPWGRIFRDLIDLPAIAPYLQTLLGQRYRLDHDYLHIIRQGEGPIGSRLHGGGTPYDPCQFYHYHDGQFYNGLTAVAFNLTDVNPGEGGFGCIPGSHKSNLRVPDEWRDLSNPAVQALGCVQEVAGKAGTAIIFTEALTHGTLPWNGAGERRTLFYKYSPRPITWSRQTYDGSAFPDLTEAEQERLQAPGISVP